jgi:osmotically-inducible protein OsmY
MGTATGAGNRDPDAPIMTSRSFFESKMLLWRQAITSRRKWNWGRVKSFSAQVGAFYTEDMMAQERRYERDRDRDDDLDDEQRNWRSYGSGGEDWRQSSREFRGSGGEHRREPYYGGSRDIGGAETYGRGGDYMGGSAGRYRSERFGQYRSDYPEGSYGRSDFGAGDYGRAGYRGSGWSSGRPGYGQEAYRHYRGQGYGAQSWPDPAYRERRGEDYPQRWRDVGAGEQRGFWDRASDEVSSWFGDEDAERRRRMDQFRGRGPKNYTRSDDRIREDVCDRLSDDWGVDASDVDVSVSKCEVTLSGTVDSREQRRRAEDCAEQVSGVKHVQNNLRVKERHLEDVGGSASQ